MNYALERSNIQMFNNTIMVGYLSFSSKFRIVAMFIFVEKIFNRLNLPISFLNYIFFRKIVQKVEQWFSKPKARGSNPFFPVLILYCKC